MKPHYFNQEKADDDDSLLSMAKWQGYVLDTCLLGGITVMDEVAKRKNPCWGCEGPREKCHGVPKR